MISIFIIPQNFNFKNKFLGFIDYSTLIFLIICYLISYLIINFIFPSFYTKTIIFILLNVPLTLLSIIGFYNENIVYVLYYIIKFFKNKNIYFYRKNFFDM